MMTPLFLLADGGGPILALVNFSLFTFGQVWIMGVEWLYLRRQLDPKSLPLGSWIVGINFASAAAGAIALPVLWAVLTMVVSECMPRSDAADVLLALGTWIIGDNSPHVGLAMSAAGVGFLLTYFPTVWIEFALLRRLLARREIVLPHLKRHVYVFNALSYAGLVLFVIVALLCSA